MHEFKIQINCMCGNRKFVLDGILTDVDITAIAKCKQSTIYMNNFKKLLSKLIQNT